MLFFKDPNFLKDLKSFNFVTTYRIEDYFPNLVTFLSNSSFESWTLPEAIKNYYDLAPKFMNFLFKIEREYEFWARLAKNVDNYESTYFDWLDVLNLQHAYPGLKEISSASLQNAYAPSLNTDNSVKIVEEAVNPNNVESMSLVNRLCIDTFGPMLEITNFIVLEKSNPIRLYDFLPPSADRNVIQNFDSWLLTGENMPTQTSSVPDTKLYYPEPFVASPSFAHEEVWFLHILYYNYWLWFFFISLIMFYMITFISVVRWCNLRVKPKRETRGVSRSKCADLITACVPVSWAVSIIISETVDAADYYDGFGTGELVIGIRAYQWGWEYFYPRNIDTNYNLRLSYSSLLGRSVKYSTSSVESADSNQLWKYFQKKNAKVQPNTPGHLLLSPPSKTAALNNINFSDMGNAINSDANAFKKIQAYSKLSTNANVIETSNINARFDKLGTLYLSDYKVAPTSTSYHTDRQHTYSSAEACLPSFSTLADQASTNKYSQYALNFSQDLSNKSGPVGDYNFFNWNNQVTQTNITFPSKAVSSLIGSNFSKLLNTYSPDRTSTGVKDYTSTKISNRPDRHFNSDFFTKPNVHSKVGIPNSSELSSSSYNGLFTWNLFNSFRGYQFRDLQSTNQQFLSLEKNLRHTPNLSFGDVNTDLSGTKAAASAVLGLSSSLNHPMKAFTSSHLNWAGEANVYSTLSTGLTLPHNSSPIFSNSSNWFAFNFDRSQKFTNLEIPNLFKGKEDSTPTHVFNSYWLSYWNRISPEHKYNVALDNIKSFGNFYLPSIAEYAEYDFKNWQALNALEDSTWETVFPSFFHDEYYSLRSHFYGVVPFARHITDYNTLNRLFTTKSSFALRPVRLDNRNINTPSFGVESLFSDSRALSMSNFNQFNALCNLDFLEDSYENLKSTNIFSPMNLKTFFHLKNPSLPVVSYASNLNMFRADFEESNWSIEDSVNTPNKNQMNYNSQSLLTNPLKLRSTVKNLMVTYSAIQKVYRSRFDEGRSNMNTSSLYNSYVSYPFLMESRSNYESLMGKNNESYFSASLFNSNPNNKLSDLNFSFNSNSSLFLDIPFLLSLKSDPARYLWFDWLSRWVSIEVQPSSIAKYSLAGLPYSAGLYEFATQLGEELGDAENYLSKMAHARRNYTPNWGYSPYFYLKSSSWFKHSPELYTDFSVESSATSLIFSSLYSDVEYYTNSLKLTSTPSFSSLNTLNKVLYTPRFELSNWDYTSSTLIDLLSKREHFYRAFLNSKAHVVGLPDSLVASPTNKLLLELRASLGFVDTNSLNSTYNYDKFSSAGNTFTDTTNAKSSLLQHYVIPSIPLNLNPMINFGKFYLNTTKGSFYDDVQTAPQLLKSQYRPMRKGITNMVRLQATSAIAMPTEMRLHILASSKDVIHSWAIPSAGIKIDCVPGYSSHRVAIFLTHGIFWGQCMEICGRYHHWMPIIVYFMKRDLFFLWCAHFIHYSDLDQSFNMLDKSLNQSPQLASFDKNTWVTEFSKVTSNI